VSDYRWWVENYFVHQTQLMTSIFVKCFSSRWRWSFHRSLHPKAYFFLLIPVQVFKIFVSLTNFNFDSKAYDIEKKSPIHQFEFQFQRLFNIILLLYHIWAAHKKLLWMRMHLFVVPFLSERNCFKTQNLSIRKAIFSHILWVWQFLHLNAPAIPRKDSTEQTYIHTTQSWRRTIVSSKKAKTIDC